MKLLLLSNQAMAESTVGNPIMLRLRDSFNADERIDQVMMLRCKNPFKVWRQLRSKARACDIVHIHFGGMYALAVWILLLGINRPKYITFHGTDIHAKAVKTARSKKEKLRIILNQKASFLCVSAYDKCGFVAVEMLAYLPARLRERNSGKIFIHKLGVDYSVFVPIDKNQAQKSLGIEPAKYALFSDVHNTTIKRRDTAEAILHELGDEYRMLVVCGVSPDMVPLYINAADFVLLTSDEEGSPNIIREALALNKPVFSVEVGDAAQQIDGLRNSSLISRDPADAASTIRQILQQQYVDDTRGAMQDRIDLRRTSRCIVDLYENSIRCR